MESKFLSSPLVFCSAILRTFILFSIQVLILIFWQSIQILSVQYDFTLELWCSETINWWALFSQSSFPALWPTIQSANWTSSAALSTRLKLMWQLNPLSSPTALCQDFRPFESRVVQQSSSLFSAFLLCYEAAAPHIERLKIIISAIAPI